MSGPQEQQKSMYSFPSASQIRQPFPRSINNGVPPKERKDLTGEFTPPGKLFFAFSNICSDLPFFIIRIEMQIYIFGELKINNKENVTQRRGERREIERE